MSAFSVRRVTITGVHLMGLKRSLSLNSKIGVGIETDRGKTAARLNDFRGIKLEPTLHPDAYTQTFVCGPVIDRANEILTDIPQVADRIIPVEAKKIDFSSLPFGLNKSDVMLFATINRGGDWTGSPIDHSLYPFQNIQMSPVAQVLHYGQSGFEGAKAYRSVKGNIVSFRLPENARRHARTSERLALTPIPENYYLEAVRRVVLANEHLVAPPGSGASMYIRPLHFGVGPQLGVAPAPTEAFMIFTSPVGPYFKGGFAPQKMLVQDQYFRSAPGLMGDVKVAGNYAGSVLPGLIAKSNKFSEVIYLDALTGKNIEEVGAANAFFMIDGTLYTPGLSGTILPGITRNSIITLARDMGITVIDNQPLPLGLALKANEAFCTGTAAVITPVGSITKGNKEVVFNNNQVGPLTQKLYSTLTDIQLERIADPYGWVYHLA